MTLVLFHLLTETNMYRKAVLHQHWNIGICTNHISRLPKQAFTQNLTTNWAQVTVSNKGKKN